MKNQYIKYLISIPEAAKEFGIGKNRLYEIVYSDPTLPIVKVGEYKKLNRKLFEQWLDEATRTGKQL